MKMFVFWARHMYRPWSISISNAHINLTCGNYVNWSWVLALQWVLFVMKQLWSITSSNRSVIYQLWINLFSLQLYGTNGGKEIQWSFRVKANKRFRFLRKYMRTLKYLMQQCTWKLAKGSTLNSTLSNWGIILVQWDLSYWNLPTSEGFRGNNISFSSDPVFQPWVIVYQSSTSSVTTQTCISSCVSVMY